MSRGTGYGSIMVSDIGSQMESDGTGKISEIVDRLIEGHLDHPEKKITESKTGEISEMRRDLKNALKEGTISEESYNIIKDTMRNQT